MMATCECGRINVELQEGLCVTCNFKKSIGQPYGKPKTIIKHGNKLCSYCGRSVEESFFFDNLCYFCIEKISLNMPITKYRPKETPWTVDSSNIKWLSINDLMQDTLKLIPKIPKDIDVIIGTARSGVPPASILALMMHLPLLIFRQSIRDVVTAGNGWRLNNFKTNKFDAKHALVIDDTVLTGNSIKIAKDTLSTKFNKLTFATVYKNPNSRESPDIWAVDLPWPHFLEWNIFNSILTRNMVVDFDGILCEDCPFEDDDDGEKYLNFILNAKPKYIIRNQPIPLIVTARIEKYREPTLLWLEKHKIKVEKLIMHPAKTLYERRRCDISEFKAEAYLNFCKNHPTNPPPHIFIESEDWQAQRISKFSNNLVLCPSSKRVYGYVNANSKR